MAYSQRYDSLAWQVAREVFGESDLAQVFYRMMKQESGNFDSDVVEGRRASSAGAQGIAQFMPATAREQGVDPLNPEQALRGGAAYLQKLIAYFDGEVAKGVAAYNAGAGRVEKAVAAGGANWAASLPGETQSYLQITQPGGETMAEPKDFPLGGRQMTPTTATQGAGGGQVTPYQVINWMKTFYTGEGEAEFYFADDRQGWTDYYRETMGLGGETGVTEAERARTALDWATANKLIAELGGDTYEQGRQRILDQMDEKHWDDQQAISEFNAWMSAALEAGKRAETVYGEEMKRKVWATPEKYYPGTEPGGINQQMYERYGLGEEYKPSPGIPVEMLPNPEQMYSRWHQNMGISQQAPPTAGGWSGQGTGMDAARQFLERMNLRPGVRQGAGR